MKYLSYYKLDKKPFQISTDPIFLWLGKKHQEALSILKYGIEDDKGFLLLTGDVGTGKTTLINAFVNSLEDTIIVARVSDPGLTKLDFMKFVAQKFQMETDFQTKSAFLIQFTTLLEQADKDQKKVLLIIDEAQHLTDEVLEEIRLLSNIENQDKKLLNIFLIGQNEFNTTLGKYNNRALRQRITLSYTLYPLDPEETKTCIEYRLGIAGCQKELFTPEAITAIHTLSEGFPRVINIICDHALLHGCREQLDKITDEVIWEISKNLHLSHMPQTVEQDSFTDSTDEEWLEASEVPPLSIEEIYKASQPLPDLEPQLTEAPRKRTGKYKVAVLLFFIAFLMSGFFVLDESTVDSITQSFRTRFIETSGSFTDETTPEVISNDTFQQSKEVSKEDRLQEQVISEEVTEEVVHLTAQKKNIPDNPEPPSPHKPLAESAPDTIDAGEVQHNEMEVSDRIAQERVAQIAVEQVEITEQKTTTKPLENVAKPDIINNVNNISAQLDTNPTWKKTAGPMSNAEVTAETKIVNDGAGTTGEQQNAQNSQIPEDPPSTKTKEHQAIVTTTPQQIEKIVLPTLPDQPQTPGVEQDSKRVATDAQAQEPSDMADEDEPTTAAEPKETQEALATEERVNKTVEPFTPKVETISKPSPLKEPVTEKTVTKPGPPNSSSVKGKSSPQEDPGAVIDWLLQSKDNSDD